MKIKIVFILLLIPRKSAISQSAELATAGERGEKKGEEKMTKPLYRILIVEDDPEEQRKAEAAVRAAGCLTGIPAEDRDAAFLYAFGEDTETGKSEAPSVKWDGILCDVHFPYYRGKRVIMGPWGLEVAVEAVKHSIPLVFCTDVYHHDAEGEFICAMAIRLSAGVNDTKNWDDAMEQLLVRIKEKKAVS